MQLVGKFKEAIRVEVGSRTRALFWHDKWCTNRPLRIKAPLICVIASNKEAMVADFGIIKKEGDGPSSLEGILMIGRSMKCLICSGWTLINQEERGRI